MNQPYAQPPVPKKGLSTGMIILIVVGVVFLLILGTCAAGVIWAERKASDFAKDMAEGGVVLVSPPAVTSELAGAKKEYVGAWKSKKGSTMHIASSGNFLRELDEDGDGVKEKTEAPIAAFVGDDMQVKLIVTLLFRVSEPPHQVSGVWHMKVDGIDYERTGTTPAPPKPSH
jgi:hypothetical protein